MSDLVGNPEDQFSRVAAHIVHFSQMTEFWKNLDWPDLIDALPMVRKLTEDVCNGAALYAELVHRKLQQAGYYDEEGQFDVTDKVQCCCKIVYKIDS